MTDPSVPVVLVVCTGNLCRSPLVAALLQREVDQAGLPALVGSAGTSAPFRRAPDRRLLKVADELDLDLRDHRSQPITLEQLQTADLVLTMTAAHRREIAARLPDVDARTSPLRAAAWKARLMAGRPVPFATWVARLAADVPEAERPRTDHSNDIPDPMGGSLREYRAMADEVAAHVTTLVSRWSGR